MTKIFDVVYIQRVDKDIEILSLPASLLLPHLPSRLEYKISQ